jgi:hypothetical protein
MLLPDMRERRRRPWRVQICTYTRTNYPVSSPKQPHPSTGATTAAHDPTHGTPLHFPASKPRRLDRTSSCSRKRRIANLSISIVGSDSRCVRKNGAGLLTSIDSWHSCALKQSYRNCPSSHCRKRNQNRLVAHRHESTHDRPKIRSPPPESRNPFPHLDWRTC